jgi:V-type H+-transporting ATPase subunit a
LLEDATADTDGEDIEQGQHGHIENLGYVTGVIPRSKIQTFERVLWRILRGNLLMKFAEVQAPVIDPSDADKIVQKNVFAIFAHGEQVINKIKKITESMGGTLYIVEDSSTKREVALQETTTRIKDLEIVRKTQTHSKYIFNSFFSRSFLVPKRHAEMNSWKWLII